MVSDVLVVFGVGSAWGCGIWQEILFSCWAGLWGTSAVAFVLGEADLKWVQRFENVFVTHHC